MTAEDFFQLLVLERLQARGVVEGPNFFFGRARGGNVEALRRFCEQAAVELRIAQGVEVDGEMVSSTRIRSLLRGGQVEAANRLLGAAFQLDGRVEVGAQRGRALGFPTANLGDLQTKVPGHGVYAAVAHLPNIDSVTSDLTTREYLAAIHIGPNPTFENHQQCKVEVHVLDYSGDLYGRRLLVDVTARLRDIAKFDSPAHLAKQLAVDVQQVRDRQNLPLAKRRTTEKENY